MESMSIKEKLELIYSACNGAIPENKNDFICCVVDSLSIEDKIRLGEWIHCSEYLPKDFGLDWVLVQFVEKDTGYVCIPNIAELRSDGKWHLQSDDKQEEDFINNLHYASSWKIIEFSPERMKSGLVE